MTTAELERHKAGQGGPAAPPGGLSKLRRFGRKFRSGRKRGIAMLEVILAIGVVGFIIAGVIVVYTQAQERQKRTESIALLNSLRGATERIFAGAPSLVGLTDDLLDSRGAVPDTARNLNAAGAFTGIRHPFNEDVNVWEDGKRFWIGFANLDDEACGDIAGAYTGKTRARAGIVNALVLNEAAIAEPTAVEAAAAANRISGSATAAVPYTTANVESACDEGEGANDLYFLFG